MPDGTSPIQFKQEMVALKDNQDRITEEKSEDVESQNIEPKNNLQNHPYAK